MLSHFPPARRGFISALIGFVSFSFADASAKWLGLHYETMSIILWTYAISLVIGLIFVKPLGGLKKTIKTKRLPIHIGRGVCAFGIAICVVNAMSMGLALANMYTILFLAPFLITICAWPVYKEPVSLKGWGIIALGFSGILIAYPPSAETLSVAELLAFAALGFIVSLSLLARPLDEEESLHSLSFYPAVTIIALSLPFIWQDITLPAMEHMPIFILNGLLVTIGLSAIAYGFRIAPYAHVAPIHYIQMVVAITLGYLVFGDVPSVLMLVGGGVIIVSGLLLVWSKERS